MSINQQRSGPSVVVVIVIASVLVAVMAGVIIALSIALLSAQGSTSTTRDESEEPQPTRSEIVLDVTWADGSTPSDDELDQLEDVITSRLERAGVTGTGFSVDDDQIRITFSKKADEDTLDAAREALEVEFRVDFRQVLDVGLCGSGNDYTDYGPDEEVIFCDREGSTALKLAPSELTGDTIIGSTTYETKNGTGWGVTMIFNPEGTATFAALTQRLIGSEGVLDRLAITLGGEVLESPQVSAVVENGKMSISGAMDEGEAEALAAELRVAARGLTLSVASATLAD